MSPNPSAPKDFSIPCTSQRRRILYPVGTSPSFSIAWSRASTSVATLPRSRPSTAAKTSMTRLMFMWFTSEGAVARSNSATSRSRIGCVCIFDVIGTFRSVSRSSKADSGYCAPIQ